VPDSPPDSPLRLQKYLADAGICSRRAAEALIAQGEVWVNGQQATLGQKITPGVDKVTASGKSVRPIAQPLMTVAVHKPPGLICSNEDPHNDETVFFPAAEGAVQIPVLLRRPPGQGQRGPGHLDDRRRAGEPPDAPVQSRGEALLRGPEGALPGGPACASSSAASFSRANASRSSAAWSTRARAANRATSTSTCITARSGKSHPFHRLGV